MALDTDKLSKLLAMASSTEDGEALNALRLAKTLLAKEGLSFTDLAQSVRAAGRATAPTAPANTTAAAGGNPFGNPLTNPMRSFADWMEERQPGYKDQQAILHADRTRQRALDRAGVLERYGSAEAALAPTELERLVDAAAQPFKREEMKDYLNGRFMTETLDGWWETYKDPPPRVVEAVSGAYPLPATVSEAKAEYDWWRNRDREIELIEGEGADTYLSLAAQAREHVVRRLYRYDLPARTTEEVALRLEADEGDGWQDSELVTAAIADLRRLGSAPPPETGPHPAHHHPMRPTCRHRQPRCPRWTPSSSPAPRPSRTST